MVTRKSKKLTCIFGSETIGSVYQNPRRGKQEVIVQRPNIRLSDLSHSTHKRPVFWLAYTPAVNSMTSSPCLDTMPVNEYFYA